MHSTQTMATFNTVARVLEQLAAHPDMLAEREAWERDRAAKRPSTKPKANRYRTARPVGDKLPQAIEAVSGSNAQIGREAEAFDRSNLNRDFDQWGPELV